MKRYKVIIAMVSITSMLFISCGNKTQDREVNDKNLPNKVIDNQKEPIDNKPINNAYNNQNQEVKKTLEEIKKKANDGMIINCEFKLKETPMESVRMAWRTEDKCDQVVAAKGFYATYEERKVVFGFNKGESVFEIRSFDERLNKITINDVKSFFGEPQYNAVINSNERIIGYVVNEEFKLEFIFDKESKDNSNPIVKHYQVFYPKGTVNIMAEDGGREW